MALLIAYGGPYLGAACLKVIQDCLAFLQPQLLRLLLAYISSYQDSRRLDDGSGPGGIQGFVITVSMFCAAVIQSIILNQACLLHVLRFTFVLTILNIVLSAVL
jgi:ATP-binding cassette subfamily C (CFTR/MRP) protein 1